MYLWIILHFICFLIPEFIFVNIGRHQDQWWYDDEISDSGDGRVIDDDIGNGGDIGSNISKDGGGECKLPRMYAHHK